MPTLIQCPFHPCVAAVARKRPWSFCQKCRWQVTPKHTYTLDPSKSEWADYAAVQVEYGNLSGNKLTCNSSGNTYRHLSSLSHCGLILAERVELVARANLHFKKRQAQAGTDLSNILPKSLHMRKKPPPPHFCIFKCVEVIYWS